MIDAGVRQYESWLSGLRGDSLHLIMLPTERCNLHCVYCYEDHVQGRMREEVIQGVCSLLESRSAELTRLQLDWFGGEPLLGLDTVVRVASLATSLARRNPLVRYHGAMTTNGTLLTEPVLEQLVDVGVRRFQVTLDGQREAHDQTRVAPSGAGSFDQVWRNLMSIRRGGQPVEVMIRVHLHASNEASVLALASDIAEVFGGDERFSVMLRPISDLGGPGSGALVTLGKPRVAELAAKAGAELQRSGVSVAAMTEDYVCYAAMPDSFVVRPNGEISKCTVALDDPMNQLGSIAPNGDLSLNQDRLAYWFRGVSHNDGALLRCPQSAQESRTSS